VARCGIPLGLHTSRAEFMKHLKPLNPIDKREA